MFSLKAYVFHLFSWLKFNHLRPQWNRGLFWHPIPNQTIKKMVVCPCHLTTVASKLWNRPQNYWEVAGHLQLSRTDEEWQKKEHNGTHDFFYHTTCCFSSSFFSFVCYLFWKRDKWKGMPWAEWMSSWRKVRVLMGGVVSNCSVRPCPANTNALDDLYLYWKMLETHLLKYWQSLIYSLCIFSLAFAEKKATPVTMTIRLFLGNFNAHHLFLLSLIHYISSLLS